MFLVLELGTVGDTEPSTWETCHPQWRRSGWGSWWETLGSSPTWRFFSNCWEQMLTVSCAFKVGVNVKDGGKYAFIGMESREAGDAVISALHLLVWSFIYIIIFFSTSLFRRWRGGRSLWSGRRRGCGRATTPPVGKATSTSASSASVASSRRKLLFEEVWCSDRHLICHNVNQAYIVRWLNQVDLVLLKPLVKYIYEKL